MIRCSCRVLALAMVGLFTAACHRAEPPAAAAPPPAPVSAMPVEAATPASDAAPPEGVLRAYAWHCDDGHDFVMRNLYRERAVSIPLHDGSHRLDQTSSASGARYANASESIVFWTKGGTASLERKGQPTVHCEERRAESLQADEQLRSQ